MLQAERLRLEGERQALELAKEKLAKEQARFKEAEASLAAARGASLDGVAATVTPDVTATTDTVNSAVVEQVQEKRSIKGRLAQVDARRRELKERLAKLKREEPGSAELAQSDQNTTSKLKREELGSAEVEQDQSTTLKLKREEPGSVELEQAVVELGALAAVMVVELDALTADVYFEVMVELDALTADVEALESDIGVEGSPTERLALRERLLRVCMDMGISAAEAQRTVDSFTQVMVEAPERKNLFNLPCGHQDSFAQVPAEAPERKQLPFSLLFSDWLSPETDSFAQVMAEAPERKSLPFNLLFSDWLSPETVRTELARAMRRDDAFWAVTVFKVALDLLEKGQGQAGAGLDRTEPQQWAFAGTLANGLVARDRCGDELVGSLKNVGSLKRMLAGDDATGSGRVRMLAGDDASDATTEEAQGGGDQASLETTLLTNFLAEKRQDMGMRAFLEPEDVARLRDYVFTEDLMAEEVKRRQSAEEQRSRDLMAEEVKRRQSAEEQRSRVKRRQSAEEQRSRGGKLRGARLPEGAASKLRGARMPEGTAAMVSASGLVAVGITGFDETEAALKETEEALKETEEALKEVRRRVAACGLADRVRLFVFRDATQIIRRRGAACGLADRVRLFVFRDATQGTAAVVRDDEDSAAAVSNGGTAAIVRDDKDSGVTISNWKGTAAVVRDDEDSGADDLDPEMLELASSATSPGDVFQFVMMQLAELLFEAGPRFLIVAAPAAAAPPAPAGGLPATAALAALAAYYVAYAVGGGEGGEGAAVADGTLNALLLLGGLQIAHEAGHAIVHEAGHAIAAALSGLKPAWPPRVLPGGPFGALGTTTRLRDFPADTRALFDYCAAGPVAGIAASAVMLFMGLKATAEAAPAAAALFPRMPTYLLQSSFLVGGIVNTALPNLALYAPDIAAPLTPLHPLAFAGAAGLFVNALHCLALGGSDGAMALSSVVPSVPHNFKDTGKALAVGFLSAVSIVFLGWQLWQSFFGDMTQENLFISFIPLSIIFMNKPWNAVVDERPTPGLARTLAAVSLQAFWLATLLPMPLQNFLDGGAADAAGGTGLF
ncbi:hypothetical protein JKP88DRAFT_353011 [Tribonema minus]|uniref:Uncharacterized protein n=1 Tax=Tribonema minus TaxID=303371 RepID=A0A836CKI2_9STRA|nr:hypothetical protein JKP88DRAFT_353011 [Tribonema minus]